jgi:hypothetical protein
MPRLHHYRDREGYEVDAVLVPGCRSTTVGDCDAVKPG